jgi:phosphate transport system permease protein
MIALLIVALGVIAFFIARARANIFDAGSLAGRAAVARPHSRPVYHGAFVALAAVIPSLLLLTAFSFVEPRLLDAAIVASLPAADQPKSPIDRDAIVGEVKGLASGQLADAFNPASKAAVPAYIAARDQYQTEALIASVLIAFGGATWAYTRLAPQFRARNRVERVVMGVLILASLIAVLTTFGIVFSLLFESLRFFKMVSPVEFLFGMQWSPQTAIRADQAGSSGAFGSVPLFWGTIFIGAIIAMAVAIPLGLMSAIWLTQYAPPKLRSILKPVLEILAGVPTVVYGFFAALTVAPALRDFAFAAGIPGASSESALAAGLVMGVMIIPFVSSMADDSMAAVPQAMRDGSLAMGATPSETIKRVLVPAALPGIVGGVLLAVSRAIGETMIVVMAAGLAANMTANPFASVTTVTTQIVTLLTGDQEFDSSKTLSAFALGLVLFVVTLILNIVALRVVKKYREAYE